MKKVLFINLKTSQDTYLTLKLARQWSLENPGHEVNLLTWQDNEQLVYYVPEDIKFHVIQREKIHKFKTSEIIPDFHALNQLWKDIEDIINEDWEIVFNASNDNITCILASVLKFKSFKGLYINKNKNIIYSNHWAKYLNEVYPQNPIAFNKLDLLKRVFDIKGDFNFEPLNPSLFQEAHDAINALKASKEGNKKIIGIDIQSFIGQEWNIDELALSLNESKNYLPVCLHKIGAGEQVDLLEKIQLKLGDDILIIEIEDYAFEAIINSLDVLIARDSLSSQISYALSTPCLQIEQPDNLIKNTGYSYQEKDIILSTNNYELISEEVIACLDILTIGKPRTTNDWLFNDIFHVKKDELGSFLVHINPIDSCYKNIMNYHTRAFFSDQFLNNQSLLKSKTFSLFTNQEIRNYCLKEESQLDLMTKQVLKSLRLLKESKLNPNKLQSFLDSFDVLFRDLQADFVSDSINSLYRSELEALKDKNSEVILSSLEVILFSIKSKYQELHKQIRPQSESPKSTNQEQNI